MSTPRPSGGTGGGGIPIDFLNGSILDAGDPSYGSNSGGGIEQVCSIDYRQRWEGGRLWFFDQIGAGVREVRMNFSEPSVNDDDRDSMRFRVGSKWVHQDGREWVCRDATEGDAIWDLVSSQPNVIYITTAGDDTNGDGTMSNPFRTLGRAVTVAAGAACLFQVGVGSFSVTRIGWPPNQPIRGSGWGLTSITVNSSSTVDLIAYECDVSVDSSGDVGASGASGTFESPNGAEGQPGGNAGSIFLRGTCRVLAAIALGGIGGNGGSGWVSSGEEDNGQGGRGGNGGDSGYISLKGIPFVLGPVENYNVSGGNGGFGPMGDGVGGNTGSAGELFVEGCNCVEASFSSGSVVTVSRSLRSGSMYVQNDIGGNSTL